MSDPGTTHDLFDRAARVRSVWTTLGNSRAAAAAEHIPIRACVLPHYQAPTSLNDDESPLVIPALARTVTLSVELACRVGAGSESGRAADPARLIGSYHVFVAVRDSSHYELARTSSNFPHFGRQEDPTWDYDYEVPQAWADGFAILSRAARDAADGPPERAAMRLEISGLPPVQADTSAYVHSFAETIKAITGFVRLEAGAVISLGRAGDVVTLPPDGNLGSGTQLTASVEGVGTVTIPVVDERSDDNYYTRSRKNTDDGEYKKGLFF